MSLYSEDNLNTSIHGGTTGTPTTYTFSYVAFNALSEVKEGGHTLIENTYDVNYRSFNLTSEKYGNNQRVNLHAAFRSVTNCISLGVALRFALPPRRQVFALFACFAGTCSYLLSFGKLSAGWKRAFAC